MGGTASTVLWNLGYDPIVHAAEGPARLDDLSGPPSGFATPYDSTISWWPLGVLQGWPSPPASVPLPLLRKHTPWLTA
eukprot:8672370-Lingulodinium_polyedra.AAC.1